MKVFRYDQPSKDSLWLALAAIGLAAVTVAAFALDARPEWRDYQDDFRALVAERFGDERAARVEPGLKHVWVPELRRSERCVTCHEGLGWKGLETAENPARTHPAPSLMQHHPVERFGCVACHGGQPYATTVAAAHGEVEHWEEPLLSRQLAADYVLQKPEAIVEVRCNACHRYDRSTEGTPEINFAKELVATKGCRACHVINGRGGKVGPDLTAEGDKSPEQFDFSRVSPASAFAWHLAHLKNPKEVVPTSLMPSFGFDSRQAQALALLIMSWRDVRLPAHYLPGARLADVPTPEELENEKRMATGPGAFFVEKGCYICHSISGWAIKSPTDIGPDLTKAYEDTTRRFGRALDDFLRKPTGTMGVVLSSQIKLTDEELGRAIALLTRVYREQQAQQPEQQPGGVKTRRP